MTRHASFFGHGAILWGRCQRSQKKNSGPFNQKKNLFTLLSAANTNNQCRYIRSVWFIYRKSANTSKYKLYKHKTSRDGHTHKNSFFHVVGGSQRGLKFPARYEIFVPTNLYATKSSCKNPQICLYYKLLQDTCGFDFPASPINL